MHTKLYILSIELHAKAFENLMLSLDLPVTTTHIFDCEYHGIIRNCKTLLTHPLVFSNSTQVISNPINYFQSKYTCACLLNGLIKPNKRIICWP